MRYLGANIVALSAMYVGINGVKYTGIDSIKSIGSLLSQGIPTARILTDPTPQIFRDVGKFLEDGDIRELFFFTWNQK